MNLTVPSFSKMYLAGENKSATIAGFVFSNLERIPKVGDYVDFSGWRFTVLRLSGFRIVRVKAEKVTGVVTGS